MSEGAYPAGGALLIGPDSTLNEVGLASGDTLMVQVQSTRSPPQKKTTKKKPRDDSDEEGGRVPSDGGRTAATPRRGDYLGAQLPRCWTEALDKMMTPRPWPRRLSIAMKLRKA